MSWALLSGFAGVRRSFGLVFVVFFVNLGAAAMLAVPLASLLERELRQTDSAYGMLYGFDTSWWSHWNDAQAGWTKSFGPEIFGVGFAFHNLDLLLRGELPLRLLRPPEGEADGDAGASAGAGLDAVILGLGALYLLFQTFLLGGILGVFRSEQGSWTVRGLLHGSGFYFARLLRIALIAVAVDYLLLRLNVPFTRWADAQAREAVSESTAMAWALGRHALLLLGLLLVNMLSSYAKVITVVEERSSALLAWISAIGFCASSAGKAVGHYLSVVLLGVALLFAWSALDARLDTTGYKSQLASLLLSQTLVLGGIGLRLSLLAGQMALYRKLTGA